MHNINRLIILFALILLSFKSYAAGLNYYLGFSETYSDNINKSIQEETGWESDFMLGLNGTSGLERGGRLSTGVNARVDYITRDEDLFDDTEDTRLTGSAFANLNVLPGLFQWNNNLSSNMFLSDITKSNNADNLFNVVSFNSSPTLSFKITSVDNLIIKGNYNHLFQENGPDSKRKSGSSILAHRTRTGRISLSYQYLDTDNEGLAANYRKEDALISYSHFWNNINATIGAGESRTNIDGLDDEVDSTILKFNLNWEPIETGRLRLAFNRDVSDSFQYLSFSPEQLFSDAELLLLNLDPTLIIGDIFSNISETDRYTFRYEQRIWHNKTYIQYRRIESQGFFEGSLFILSDNKKDDIVDLGFERALNSLTNLEIIMRYRDLEFNEVFNTREFLAGLYVARKFSQNFEIKLNLLREKQSSDFVLSNYDANSVIINFRYTDNLF